MLWVIIAHLGTPATIPQQALDYGCWEYEENGEKKKRNRQYKYIHGSATETDESLVADKGQWFLCGGDISASTPHPPTRWRVIHLVGRASALRI